MNLEQHIQHWKWEESIAHIHGWDFSHIEGRYMEEEDLPWDYRQVILSYLKPEMRLLDVDTGGGEFLLSLGHPHANTAATEAYRPNVALCQQVFAPLGVIFREADGKGRCLLRIVPLISSLTGTGITTRRSCTVCSNRAGCSSPSRWVRKMTVSW